jgi:hypothetical protein
MPDYILGRYESILLFLSAIVLVDFLVFMRAWSYNEMRVKRIFIFILKLDAGIILSAALLMTLVNVPAIVAFFMK